jgi:hypothetical protein
METGEYKPCLLNSACWFLPIHDVPYGYLYYTSSFVSMVTLRIKSGSLNCNCLSQRLQKGLLSNSGL